MITTAAKLATRSVAIVAGEGKLPSILAKSAKDKGFRSVILALSPQAEALCAPYADVIYPIAPGQLGRNLKILQKEDIREIVFIGKIPKLNLLRNLHKLDWMAVRELSKLPNLNDDTIQRGMGDVVEAHGLKVLLQSDFLRHLFPDYGVITKQQPSASEYADIEFGFKVAKELARLDIGQMVVVKNQMILAVEAIEGTDETIKRAVQLARKPVVVVKVAKLNHDQRFDTPTVGMTTLNSMLAGVPGGVLAVEARQTMMVEQEEMANFADANGISLVAV